jgi:hypothetical protein
MNRIHYALVQEGQYAFRLTMTEPGMFGSPAPDPPAPDHVPAVACGEPHPAHWSCEARHVDCPACLLSRAGQS